MSATPIPPPSAVGRFFLPGPTAVHPDVLMAQARNVIGHRGNDIKLLMADLQRGLKPLFGTSRPVFIGTCSGSGMMEMGVRNAVGSRMLSLVNGAFSERFARIGEACGFAVERIAVPWGQVVGADQLADRLAGVRYDAVTMCHSETSTGALTPVDELAPVVRERQPEALVLVDSVSGAGGLAIEADEWGLDFVLTGSQKAFAVPPGLGFCVASERMMARSQERTTKGFYFDLTLFAKNLELEQTPTTPAVTLLYALEAQLGRIHEEGLSARFLRHAAMAERCREWVSNLADRTGAPFRVFAAPGFRSPTVTCVELPEEVGGPEVVEAMNDRGFVIGTGYGKLKKRCIRIGHMGEHRQGDLDALLGALDSVLTASVSGVPA